MAVYGLRDGVHRRRPGVCPRCSPPPQQVQWTTHAMHREPISGEPVYLPYEQWSIASKRSASSRFALQSPLVGRNRPESVPIQPYVKERLPPLPSRLQDHAARFR
jgi:hypothetical protein